jgi:heme exporter protein A
MNLQPIIRADGLCRRQGLRWVLVHLNFELQTGESLLLAGGNGAGKSTLLRLLSTLTPPSQGELELFGTSVKVNRRPQRNRIGLLGHTNQLYPELTPSDHLQLWSRLAGMELPKGLLDRVELADRAHDPARTFSAGMCKRLALARLMLLNPDLILLDEPFGQLDAQGVSLMQEAVEGWRDQGKTVVLATHLIERGKPLCDRALLLAHGRLKWTGPAAELSASMVAGADS